MSNDYKLAITIGGKLDASLSSAVREAQGMLDGLNGNGGNKGGMLSKGLSTVGSVVSKIGQASVASFGAIGSAMAATGTTAIQTGMDYETAMSQVAATLRMDKTAAEFGLIEDITQELGKTTAFTMTEAAEGANILAQAGYSAEDIYKTLPTVLNLAGAGAIGMADSARYVATTLNTMGMEKTEENAQHLADVFAVVASSVETDVAGIGEAFIRFGGTGASLHDGVEEAAALMGILADAGIEGAEIGTHFRNIVMNLKEARNDDAAARFEQLGISAYDAEGNLRNMAEVLGDLKAGMEGMTTQEQDAILADIFKTTDQAAARALLENLDKYGVLFEKAKTASDDAGASAEMYKTQIDNLKGDLDLMQSAVDAFMNSLYKSFVGGEGSGLRGIVQEVSTIVNDLQAAFKTDGLDGLATGIGDALGQIATDFGDKGAEAIEAAGNFAESLVSSIGENGDAIGGAASKIITGLGTAFLEYTDDFVIAGGQLIQGLMDGMVAEGSQEQWTAGLTEMVNNIGDWFEANGESLGVAAGTIATQLATSLGEHAGELMAGGVKIIAGLAKGIIAGIPVLINQIPSIISNLAQSIITEGLPALVDAGVELAKALWEGIQSIDLIPERLDVSEALDVQEASGVLPAYQENMEAVNSELHTMYQEFVESGQEISPWIGQLMSGKQSLEEYQAEMDKITDHNDSNWMSMSDGLEEYFSYVETAMARLGIDISEYATETEEVSSTTEEMAEAAADAQTEIESTADVASQAEAEFDTLIESFGETSEAAEDLSSSMDPDALSAVVEAIDAGQIDQMTASFTAAMETFQTSANTASTSVQADFNAMSTNASMTATMIYNVFASIDLSGVASNMMAGLTEGIRAGGADAIAEAESIANQIAEKMQAALKIQSPSRVMMGIGGYIGQGLVIGMQDTERDVANAAGGLAGASINGMMQGAEMDGGGVSGGGVTFSPQITIQGNASESDVRSALSWGMEQFRTMYQRMMADDRRAAYV